MLIPTFSKFGGSLLPDSGTFVSPKGCRFSSGSARLPGIPIPIHRRPRHADLAPWAPGGCVGRVDGGGADGVCGAGVVATRREGQSLCCRESTVRSDSVSSGLLCLKTFLIETGMDFTTSLKYPVIYRIYIIAQSIPLSA